jgi:SNF2 family DNA or RNA helicase
VGNGVHRLKPRRQQRAVEYVILLCAGTIEENEYARLLRKQASAKQLLGDDTDEPPTRKSMLREAIDAARAIGISPAEVGVAPMED